MIDPESLITNDEAARLLGLKPQTLMMWRHESRGPAYVKVGRYVYYRRTDLSSWLTSHRCDPEAA